MPPPQQLLTRQSFPGKKYFFQPWKKYLHGIPEYLAQNYWWAYLSPVGVWFFSHRLIVHLILYGQYRNILHALLKRLGTAECGRMLQLSCAYGELTPALSRLADEFHLADVAMIQLETAQSGLRQQQQAAHAARMNAETLGYATDSFDTLVIFFLLHELPAPARQNALNEALRVLKPGGRLLLVDYAAHHGKHFLHNRWWSRLIEKLEPFLHEFWHSDLVSLCTHTITAQGKKIMHVGTTDIFRKFYRVEEFRVE